MGYIGSKTSIEAEEQKLITLQNLKTFLTQIQSQVDTSLDKNSNHPVANSVVTDRFEKSFWKGTYEEFEAAVAAGKITGDTVIEMLDDETETVYTIATSAEIDNIFNN